MAKPRTSKTEAPKKRVLKVKLSAENKRVPNPLNGRRMEFGKEYEVPDAPYWRRRVMAGDVKLTGSPDVPVGTPKIHASSDADKNKTTDKNKTADKKSTDKKDK